MNLAECTHNHTIHHLYTVEFGPKPDEDKNEPAKEDMAETKAKESITDKIEINEENDVEKLLEEAKIEADFREREATKNKSNATTGKEFKRPQDSASEKIEDDSTQKELSKIQGQIDLIKDNFS